MIVLKRIYDEFKKEDGFRVLVDRLWPRGISKDKSSIDLWIKEIGPSHDLRKWFGHNEKRWDTFKKKFLQELKRKEELLTELKTLHEEHGKITLLYSARNKKQNQASIIAEVLRRKFNRKRKTQNRNKPDVQGLTKSKLKINREWHEKNKMPKNPSLTERITWHIAHEENCSCRPIPRKLKVLIKDSK